MKIASVKARPTAREMETSAAAARPGRAPRAAPQGEVAAMLARRGFRMTRTRLDLPFDPAISEAAQDRIAESLRHYAFRLFLRGAIQHPSGFTPEEATRYVRPDEARAKAETLVDLGLAAREAHGRYRLLHPPRSFGGTLEWFVGRELALLGGFDVAAGVNFHAPGVGGDLDVIAAAEGKLVYLELKSSPPKHLSLAEVGAFFDRVRALRPDVALFVVDTALRLSDKVLPALESEIERRAPDMAAPARRVDRELWALTPHIYAVNAKPDLMANVARAIREGIFALAPSHP